jgi:DNA-binding NarL/FixJ family response regulator
MAAAEGDAVTVALIRAVVVDDHPAMRTGIAAVLDDAPDIECCGEAASGAELWPLIQRTAPDIVVLDWHLPGDDGLVLCHRVKRRRPDVGVVLFSAYADDWLVVPAALAQADALLAKSALAPTLYETLRGVAVREGPPDVQLTPAQRATLDSTLAPEDVGIAGMLLLGTPLREIAHKSGLQPPELHDRIERMLVRMSITHGPSVTYDGAA